MHGAVDAEALPGAIDESLGKDGADVDIRKALAATRERRHPESPRFPHPDSTPTIFVCRSLSLKPRVESFRGVNSGEQGYLGPSSGVRLRSHRQLSPLAVQRAAGGPCSLAARIARPAS